MKTIAIIGATGELGFRLVQSLQSAYRVIAIVRNPRKRDFSRFSGIEVRTVHDIADSSLLAGALDGCEAVINASYIWYAESIIHAVRLSGAPIMHLIFTGSTGVFTNLPSDSADRKRAAEQTIRTHCTVNWTILRPTMIYGHKNDRNISRLMRAVDRYHVFPLIGTGDSLIQPVLIHDLVRAYGIALFNPRHYKQIYNVGGAKAYSNRDLIRCVSHGLGKRVWLIPVPLSIVGAGIKLLAALKISPISAEQVMRFEEDKSIDIAPFVKTFDYEPRDFENGLPFLISDLRENALLRSLDR
jgi:nucleoside-diphosphate-sugar epimerase